MTRKFINLSEVFERHASYLYIRAAHGFPFSVLISDADHNGLPQTFAAKADADAALDQLTRQGISGAVAQAQANPENPKTGYAYYVRPGFAHGSMDCD